MQSTAQAVASQEDVGKPQRGDRNTCDSATQPNFGYPFPQIILGRKCLLKYSGNHGSEQTEFKEETRPRAPLPMRVSRLRYWDSLRENRLRAPLAQNYADSKADPSVPCFRFSSFSTHSTKNA